MINLPAPDFIKNTQKIFFLRVVYLLFLTLPGIGLCDEFTVTVRDGVDVPVTEFSANGDYLLLWLPPEWGFQGREQNTARALATRGISVWLADFHGAYFLGPGRSSLESVELKDVVSLMQQTIARTHKKLVLFSAGRGADLALRASNAWRIEKKPDEILSGLVFLYPNLYQGTPSAGEQSQTLPYLDTVNESIYLLQPELSAKRWRLDETVQQLKRGGSDIHAEIIPGVSDGFDLRDERSVEEGKSATLLPEKIVTAVAYLKSLENKTRKPATGIMESGDQNKITALNVQLRRIKSERAPELVLADINGVQVDIHKLTGKVVLLNFWATWCPPCVKELPSLERLQKKMQGKAFQILTVDIGEDEATIREFINKLSVSLTVLLDSDGQAVKPWKLNAFPTSYVVDQSGNLAYGLFGAIEWDDEVIVKQLTALIENQQEQKK